MEGGILKRVNKEMSKAEFYSAEMSKRYLNNTVSEESMARERVMETIPACLADSPVAAVIGLASSSPTRAAAHILGSFNIPLVRNERTLCIIHTTLHVSTALSQTWISVFLHNCVISSPYR